MYEFKKIIFSFLIIVFSIIKIYPEDNAYKKINVVIVYEKSKYKNPIVNKLEQNLTDRKFSVKKDTVININKYNPDNYTAVIILSGVKIFSPNLFVTAYIEKHDYKKNIIYFCSTEYEESAYGFLDQDKIDVITSASEKNNSDEIINMILEKLNIILNQ